MAILWADNFKNYGTNISRMLDGIYAEASTTTNRVILGADPDPNATGNVVSLNRTISQSSYPFTSASILRKLYGASATTAGVSFRYYTPVLPNLNSVVACGVSFTDAGNIAQVSIRLRPNGALEVTRGSFNLGTISPSPGGTPGVILGETAAGVILPSSWNHIEIKTVISDTVGSVEIRVNGITVLNLTNQDTLASGTSGDIQQIRLAACYVTGGNEPTNPRCYYKDLILWDNSGSVNNDFIGAASVYTLTPNSDDSFNWTPSTGSTGFNLIDEESPDDADYISAGDPPPAASTFGLTNLPPDIVSVKALIPVTRSRKIDGGDGNLQTGLKGTLVDLGADYPITTAFTYRWDVSELSPDTGVPWTPVEVDAVKLQVNRTL